MDTNLKAHIPTRLENSHDTSTKVKSDDDIVPAHTTILQDSTATHNHISMDLPSPHGGKTNASVIDVCDALETENGTNLKNITFCGNVLSQPSDDSDLSQKVIDDRSEYSRAAEGISNLPVNRRLENDKGKCA